MKTMLIRWCACLALAGAPAFGQGGFEGIVQSENGTTDELGAPQKYVMTISVKGKLVRVDIPAYGPEPAMSMIYRPDRRVVWILNEKESSYFEMAQEPGEAKGGSGGAGIKPTGKKKVILGYPCDQLIAESGDSRTEFWGTKKLGGLAKSMAAALGTGGEEGGMMNDELAAMGYYPLIARTSVEGVVVEWSEVKKVEKRAVSGEIFEVPKGYRKQTMQELMKGEAD